MLITDVIDNYAAKHHEDLETKLRKEQDDEQARREFHAAPMMDASPFRVEPSTAPLTEPQPFPVGRRSFTYTHREPARPIVVRTLYAVFITHERGLLCIAHIIS